MNGYDNSQQPNVPSPNPTPPPPIVPIDPQNSNPQAPQPQKSATNIILWIVSIIVILGVAGGVYYYVTKLNKKESTSQTTTSQNSESSQSSTSSGSAVEQYYAKAKTLQAATDKSKAVDTVMQPILKKIYTNNVKLADETGPMLTYVVNREITANDVTTAKTDLETAGYKAIDSSAKQLTMSQGASTWVITFAVGNTEKATIEITF